MTVITWHHHCHTQTHTSASVWGDCRKPGLVLLLWTDGALFLCRNINDLKLHVRQLLASSCKLVQCFTHALLHRFYTLWVLYSHILHCIWPCWALLEKYLIAAAEEELEQNLVRAQCDWLNAEVIPDEPSEINSSLPSPLPLSTSCSPTSPRMFPSLSMLW